MEDLRTEKEILHQLENRIDEINFYLWGEGQGKLKGKNINSPYGESTLRGRIGNNVQDLFNRKFNQLEMKMETQLSEIELQVKESNKIFSPIEFIIWFAIIVVGAGALITWILLT
jgi:hypothetical protein|tara:strand:- start:115 stop:459 length:345 start_codon:yes stop_codon:yes gene_type:complete